VQTSIDGGASWIDIAQFHFTTASLTQVVNLNSQTVITTPYTPTDGTLTASTCKDGILGPQYRIKRQSTGTYTGATSLRIDVSAQEP
jgi:hypothetical protein